MVFYPHLRKMMITDENILGCTAFAAAIHFLEDSLDIEYIDQEPSTWPYGELEHYNRTKKDGDDQTYSIMNRITFNCVRLVFRDRKRFTLFTDRAAPIHIDCLDPIEEAMLDVNFWRTEKVTKKKVHIKQGTKPLGSISASSLLSSSSSLTSDASTSTAETASISSASTTTSSAAESAPKPRHIDRFNVKRLFYEMKERDLVRYIGSDLNLHYRLAMEGVKRKLPKFYINRDFYHVIFDSGICVAKRRDSDHAYERSMMHITRIVKTQIAECMVVMREAIDDNYSDDLIVFEKFFLGKVTTDEEVEREKRELEEAEARRNRGSMKNFFKRIRRALVPCVQADEQN